MSSAIRRFARARVVDCEEERGDIQRLLVEPECEQTTCRAVNYRQLTGDVQAGDTVLLNTTAVELSLGTGGVHFVIANLSRPFLPVEASGHIMKLRYTPQQVNVLSVEEEGHPHHVLVQNFDSLRGKPVILAMLHSMVAPAAAGVQAIFADKGLGNARIAYVMTDSAALPLAFSDLVRRLKEKQIISTTVTCGQAFGGDMEAVNIYTGLMAASLADVVIVAPGPGHVGTGSKFGFSGIEQGHHIDVVNQLGGLPVVIPRVSFADSRERHCGLSHHTITILSRACYSHATVIFPELPLDKARAINKKLQEHEIERRHSIVFEDGQPALDLLASLELEVKSMGRSVSDDPAYFLAAGAAGVFAAKEVLREGNKPLSRA